MSNEQIVTQTLEWVNLMRSEYNLPPLEQLPFGTHGHAGDCAIAQALAPVSDGTCKWQDQSRYREELVDKAGEWSFSREGEVVRIALPAFASEFVIRFDKGQLDHLLGEKRVSV